MSNYTEFTTTVYPGVDSQSWTIKLDCSRVVSEREVIDFNKVFETVARRIGFGWDYELNIFGNRDEADRRARQLLDDACRECRDIESNVFVIKGVVD